MCSFDTKSEKALHFYISLHIMRPQIAYDFPLIQNY